MREALPGLHEDVPGDPEEHEAVGHGGQDLDPVVAVRPFRAGGPLGELHGGQGEDEPGHVGEHVARVGQERQASGQEARRHLDRQEAQRQGQDEGQAAGGDASGRGVGVIVSHPPSA